MAIRRNDGSAPKEGEVQEQAMDTTQEAVKLVESSKSSTEATREAVTRAAKEPVTMAVPGTGLVDPTRDSSGRIITPDEEDLPDPVVFASGVVTEGPSGDAISGSLRREDPDFSKSAQERIDAALKEAGMDKEIQAPALDPIAYKHQEAARVRVAAEAAQLDLTQPGGRFLVGGVLVDCNGRRIEE